MRSSGNVRGDSHYGLVLSDSGLAYSASISMQMRRLFLPFAASSLSFSRIDASSWNDVGRPRPRLTRLDAGLEPDPSADHMFVDSVIF